MQWNDLKPGMRIVTRRGLQYTLRDKSVFEEAAEKFPVLQGEVEKKMFMKGDVCVVIIEGSDSEPPVFSYIGGYKDDLAWDGNSCFDIVEVQTKERTWYGYR